MAISELYTLNDVAVQVGESYGDVSQLSLDKIYNKVNRALRIISRRGTWPFFAAEDESFATVADQETYKLRSGVKIPKFLHMRDPAKKLVMVDLRTLRRLYPNNTETTGTPQFWRIVNFDKFQNAWKIALWPIPDGVITIYVDADKNPPLLVDPSDDLRSTGLPEEMIETVINLAVALMYEQSADIYQEKMAQALAMLEDDYYRFGVHIDDNMNAREHSGVVDLYREDPTLPLNFSG